jgi:hypothetical protein
MYDAGRRVRVIVWVEETAGSTPARSETVCSSTAERLAEAVGRWLMLSRRTLYLHHLQLKSMTRIEEDRFSTRKRL